MTTYDLAIIGAGPAGEAAAFEARRLGLSVAIAEHGWFGGSCPHIGCIPSKSLLHAAARHRDDPTGYSWARAVRHRDAMVNRGPDDAEPDDAGHVDRLRESGARTIRGTARIAGRGRLDVKGPDGVETLLAHDILVAVGSVSSRPPIPGLDEVPVWTNRDATLTRQLPESLVVLGGGPTGCEMAQVFARYGVPTTVVQSGDRLAPSDHPRNSAAIEHGLRASGVTLRLGVRAVRASAGTGDGGRHRLDLDDESAVEGHAILLAVGRRFPVDGLGLEHYDLAPDGGRGLPRDGRLSLSDGLWVAGDPAGPELHTHQGHYQGELVARAVAGQAVEPDYRALPRATYTDPEAASVGLTLGQAREAGLDTFEVVAAFPETTRGYTLEAETGHVTLVVDRASTELVGAAIAAPDASAAIHECVLAIRARIPMAVLADTIHAFPSTSRILNGLYAEAARRLAGDA